MANIHYLKLENLNAYKIASELSDYVTNFAVVIARTPTLRRGTWQSDKRFPRSVFDLARNNRGAKLEYIIDKLRKLPIVINYLIKITEIKLTF
ncbi:hypothetical protein A3D03_05120 [Candidatus Gottesmanbacteria bacterium RIFCSPHIGHO2_02_FULL_40_13]|uniref:Uncharacterized protein n=1 Tax=Candidatus Gottesmanbacteria bacterium RIFCSPHIGHO2_02_FULL_40_13 TaxID=1798384 RepID=A0A1F6ABW9_9BACT|nr:MAG: hypothetical protein A3D03_05120 [Candidatus Gottesmanbacteria bacterium RIFCSPHIGHO2_02_FULL_40_13]